MKLNLIMFAIFLASVMTPARGGPSTTELTLSLGVLENAKAGDLVAVKKSIDDGAPVNVVDPHDGSTPLHWTAYLGNEEMAAFLISKGADVNASSKVRRTPLHWASENGQTHLVELLLVSGSDPRAKDRWGDTPANLIKDANPAILAMLNMPWPSGGIDSDGRTQLHRAAERGLVNVIKVLIKSHADVNARDNEGRTPLHLAVFHNRADAVKALLAHGANPNAADPFGLTPLFDAKSKAVAVLLLEAGAKLDWRDETRQTPLHWMIAANNKAVAELLIERGADAGAKDKFGRTPADVAMEASRQNPARR